MTSAGSQPGRAVGVLMVDDQAVFRGVARDVIDATPGFQAIGEASSGAEALTLSETLRPDLVLLDVRMPGMDGIETARRFTHARPESIVVLISLEEPPDVGPVARGCGAAAFIRKQDFSPAVLADLWATHRRR
jgi:DNA-binding NarL/FixJ family response regulator